MKQAGKWVFGKSFGKKSFKKAIGKFLDEWEASEVDVGTDYRPVFTLVAAPCCPADNLLLAARDAAFPEKLAKMVASPEKLTWLLKERDIDVDIAAFNSACIETFIERFRPRRKFGRIVYARHSKLDAQELSKCVLAMYGKSVCSLASRPSCRPLVDLNSLVAKHCSRAAARKLPEYKLAVKEAEQMVEQARKTRG